MFVRILFYPLSVIGVINVRLIKWGYLWALPHLYYPCGSRLPVPGAHTAPSLVSELDLTVMWSKVLITRQIQLYKLDPSAESSVWLRIVACKPTHLSPSGPEPSCWLGPTLPGPLRCRRSSTPLRLRRLIALPHSVVYLLDKPGASYPGDNNGGVRVGELRTKWDHQMSGTCHHQPSSQGRLTGSPVMLSC